VLWWEFCLWAVGAFGLRAILLLVARRGFITGESFLGGSPGLLLQVDFTMDDSVAPTIPRAVAAGERGLVPVHGYSYAAPGGDYHGLHIVHVLGCANGENPEFDNELQNIVSSLDLRTFDAVDKVCFGILAARCCDSLAVASAGCHVDRSLSLGFYARFHTP